MVSPQAPSWNDSPSSDAGGACQASRAEDVEMILSAIPNVDEFNRVLRDLLCRKDVGLFAQWKAENESVSSYTEALCVCISSVARLL